MKFREFKTSSGKLVLAGKSAENNEELVDQAAQNEYVLHTSMPGSPFTNIKAPIDETTKTDLAEAAVFCARYSQDWRDNKRDVLVHVFTGKDLYKEKGMKTGTFGVKRFKEIKVRKDEIDKFQKE